MPPERDFLPGLSSPEFLHKTSPSGKIAALRKNWKLVTICHLRLCKPIRFFHNPHPLWKTPVEKHVENVEKS